MIDLLCHDGDLDVFFEDDAFSFDPEASRWQLTAWPGNSL